MKTRKKIIIDTDPGHDDALALLLMLCSDSIDVRLITTVAGNSTVQNCTNNAYLIRALADAATVPIASGAAYPLCRALQTAVTHGSSGLDGVGRVPAVELDGQAVNRMLTAIRENPQEVTLLVLGPETNIAQAILRDEATMREVKELVIMGGAFTVRGNQTSAAEFNIFSDPEAARIVAEFPVPKTYIPLDVCNRIQVPLEEFGCIKDTGLRKTVFAMMRPYIRNLKEFELDTRGALMYDVLAAYYVLRPTMCNTRVGRVSVETDDEDCIGKTTMTQKQENATANRGKIVQSIPYQQFVNDFFAVINTGNYRSKL